MTAQLWQRGKKMISRQTITNIELQNMITEEQIKKLKPGDPLIIHGVFESMDTDGDFIIETLFNSNKEEIKDLSSYSPSCVSLPEKPKYDPCRPFKEGDIVRYVERAGRSYVDAPPVGATCRVCGGEDRVGMVCVEFKFSENEESARHEVPFYYLELVTPVEIEPYYVERQGEKSGGLCYTVHKHGGYVESTFYFGKYRSRDEQQAKAAAEAECKRLNDEWRKEQS